MQIEWNRHFIFKFLTPHKSKSMKKFIKLLKKSCALRPQQFSWLVVLLTMVFGINTTTAQIALRGSETNTSTSTSVQYQVYWLEQVQVPEPFVYLVLVQEVYPNNPTRLSVVVDTKRFCLCT